MVISEIYTELNTLANAANTDNTTTDVDITPNTHRTKPHTSYRSGFGSMDYYLHPDNNGCEGEMDHCSLDPHEYADYFNGNWGW